MTSPVSMQWDPADFRERIQAVLDAFLDEQADRLAPLGGDAARLVAEARTSVRGGKRFRAAFCCWGYRAIRPDVPDEDALARACAALELLHASALVHDDYMDASDTRRGRPATHRAFEAEHRDRRVAGRPDQYGAAAAILLGDLLLGWSEELLRRCGLPGGVRRTGPRGLRPVPHRGDRRAVPRRVRAGPRARRRRHRDDRAALQVRQVLHRAARCTSGPRWPGRRPAQLEELSRFGLPLGEAFQLRDDLLGVYGDPATTGKPAGDDLVEGKRTVLVALALDGTDREAARRLDAALGTGLDEAAVADLRDIIDRSGAHAQVEEVIEALAERAVAALDTPTVDDAARGRAARPGRRRHPAHGLSRPAPAQSRLGSPATSGPSPRSSTANGTPRSALTRDPSTLSAMLKAFSSSRASVAQPSHSSTTPVGAAADVVQAVGERVEVLAVPVGEGRAPRPTAARKSALPPSSQPSTWPKPQPACSTRVPDVVDVEGAVPQVDAGVDPAGQQCRESAHRTILSKDAVVVLGPVELAVVAGHDAPRAAVVGAGGGDGVLRVVARVARPGRSSSRFSNVPPSSSSGNGPPASISSTVSAASGGSVGQLHQRQAARRVGARLLASGR